MTTHIGPNLEPSEPSYHAEQLRRTRIALATIMRLVENGVLVRNTAQDANPVFYMRQSTTLVLALQQAQEVLAQ